MLYVSSSKTLSFKNTSSKNVSKDAKESKDTSGARRQNQTKTIGLKRGSLDSKENIHSNIQLAKLVQNCSPLKEHTAKKDTFLGIKIHKRKEDNKSKQQQAATGAIDLQGFTNLAKGKNQSGPKLKIHLKESVQTKSSFDDKRKFSGPLVLHNEGWHCINHPDKKAKYELNMQGMECVYCCLKCALSMAPKGYKFKQIQPQEDSSERAQMLQAFLTKIQQLTPKMRCIIGSFQRMRLSVNTTYEQQLDRHSNYYDSIINQFASLKRQGQQQLKQHRDKSLKQLSCLQKTAKQHLEDTVFIQQDVIPNINLFMSNTMNKLNEEKLNSIMEIYTQQIKHIEAKILELGSYKPSSMATLEGDVDKKLESCLASIPYFKLEVMTEEQQELEDSTGRVRTEGSKMKNGIDSHMYFSFENLFNQLRSGERTASKSKSQPKESEQHPSREGSLLKQLASSNEKAAPPTISVFSDEGAGESGNTRLASKRCEP